MLPVIVDYTYNSMYFVHYIIKYFKEIEILYYTNHTTTSKSGKFWKIYFDIFFANLVKIGLISRKLYKDCGDQKNVLKISAGKNGHFDNLSKRL